MSNRRNLVLGAAFGYSAVQLEPFVKSFRRHNQRDEIHLFTLPLSNNHKKLFNEYSVNYTIGERAPSVLPSFISKKRHNAGKITLIHKFIAKRYSNDLGKISPRNRIFIKVAIFLTSPVVNRNLYYKLHANRFECRKYTDKILISDTRDVLFQSDPFESENIDTLLVAMEGEGVTIEAQGANRFWYSRLYPKDYDCKKNETVSCAGTVLGKADSVLDYIDAMSSTIMRYLPTIRGDWGHDQAIHNNLVHNNLLQHRKVYNFNGPILSMYTESPENFRLNSNNQLINKDSTAIPIIHQYTEHPTIEKVLIENLQLTKPTKPHKSSL